MPEKLYPNLPRFLPIAYDHSGFKLFKECHRKYLYRIILGRVAKVSKYQTIFDFGSAYHKFREVLELRYIAGASQQEAFGEALMAAMSMNLTKGEGKYEFYNRALLSQTCKTAFDLWKLEKDKGRIKVLAVEQPFNIELGDGIFISGRADQIIDIGGKIWGRDFKTTSKLQQYFEYTLDPNDQATRYIFMESKLHFGNEAINNGKKIEGIIFEVAQNTAPNKDGKLKETRIFNSIVTKNQYQLQQWQKEQLFLHKLLDMCIEHDTWAMHETACSFCDYHSVCKAPSEASQEYKLRNDFNLSPWDPMRVDQLTLSEL